MSENQQAQQGETVEQSFDTVTQEEQNNQQQKSHEELVRRLRETAAEAKQYRLRLAEEKKKREEAERKALADAGNWQEVANRISQEAELYKERAEKLKHAFAMKTIADKISLEAAKAGCVDPELLVNILPIDQINIDDEFNVDQSAVKVLIEDVKKSKPFLFKKEQVKVSDVTPARQPSAKPVEKMTAQELEQFIKEKFGK